MGKDQHTHTHTRSYTVHAHTNNMQALKTKQGGDKKNFQTATKEQMPKWIPKHFYLPCLTVSHAIQKEFAPQFCIFGLRRIQRGIKSAANTSEENIIVQLQFPAGLIQISILSRNLSEITGIIAFGSTEKTKRLA